MQIRHVRFLLALACLTAPASADSWYVDAVHGSDSNSGTSPETAWRTLTHALLAAPDAPPGGAQVIHVAPGRYDPALGESFPLYLRNGFQILGDGGSASTTIESGGTGALMLAQHYLHCPGCNFIGPGTRVQGFTLRGAGVGVALSCAVGGMALEVEDLRITEMGTAGISLGTSFLGSMSVRATRTEITGCQRGLLLDGSDAGYLLSLDLEDSRITGNLSHAIEGSGPTRVAGTRVQLTENAGDGIHIAYGQPSLPRRIVSLADCLVARNGGVGVFAGGTYTWMELSGFTVGIQGSTIAENGLRGLDLFYEPPITVQHDTTLGSTLIFGNPDDVYENPAYTSFRSVSYCDVGDGDFAGTNGNISADPLFRGAGDFRPAWGSPCIDRGRRPEGAIDLAGVVRPVDGDLDLVEAPDIGAYEFAPLAVARRPHVGTPLVLELWGPPGGQAELFLGRGGTASRPIPTPFGDFDLNPTAFWSLGTSPAGSGPPAYRAIQILSQPALVGRTFSFQARTTSTLPNPPAVYTNAVTVTTLP